MVVTVAQVKEILKMDASNTAFDAYIQSVVNATYTVYGYLDALGATAEQKDEIVKYASAYKVARLIGTFPKVMHEGLLEHLRGLLSRFIIAS